MAPDVYRIFNCRRCHEQVRICASCYRGQQFCPPCAPVARRESCRLYEATYRRSPKGKLSNGRRQGAHRDRERTAQVVAEVVTHQGSPPSPAEVKPEASSAPPSSVAAATTSKEKTDAFPVDAATAPSRAASCSFCGRPLAAFAVRPGVRLFRRGARPRLDWRR